MQRSHAQLDVGELDAFMSRDENGIFWCSECLYKASRRQDMTRHIERKHYSRGYACAICTAVQFPARDQLLKHNRTVHGIANK